MKIGFRSQSPSFPLKLPAFALWPRRTPSSSPSRWRSSRASIEARYGRRSIAGMRPGRGPWRSDAVGQNPSSNHFRRYKLRDAANDGRLLVCQCQRCRRTVYYLASDLVETSAGTTTPSVLHSHVRAAAPTQAFGLGCASRFPVTTERSKSAVQARFGRSRPGARSNWATKHGD